MKTAIAVFTFMLLLAGHALPARADCVSDCQAATYCDSTAGWDCTERLNNCYLAQCNRPEPPSRHISGAYGAIAYDEDSGAWGMADASTDEDGARKSALKYCGKHGKNCEVVESFSKSCGAITQNVKGAVAWAVNDDSRTVAEDALKKCNSKAGDKTCHIVLFHCYMP